MTTGLSLYVPNWGFATAAAITPVSGPVGRVTAITATTFTVTVQSITGRAGTTLRLQTRAFGSGDTWTTRASDATPAVNDSLIATIGAGAGMLEWRIVEEEGIAIHDGTHGLITGSEDKVATIKSAIKAIMGSLTGITSAAVHTRVRSNAGGNDASFSSLFVDASAKINTWMIELETVRSVWSATNKAWERVDSYVIRGWYGHDDDQDTAGSLQLLVQRITEALNSDIHLQGTATAHGTVQQRIVGFNSLFGRVCNHTELTIDVRWTHKP